MLLDFDKFERAQTLLESSAPADIDEQLLESNGLTMEDLDAVNEGFLKDLFGGWFKKFKTKMLRKMPGGVLRKVDGIIKKYEAEKIELAKKEIKEKEKIFKSEVAIEKGEDETKHNQVIDRAKTAIKAIRKAGNAKIDKFNTELEQIAEDKSEMVADYINLKIAEVQEKLATAELEAIEKYATEERVEELEKEVEEKKKKREELQKELETAVSKEKDLKGANAKKDEKWIRKNDKGEEVEVIIVDELGKGGAKPGMIRVKSEKGQTYASRVEDLLRKADEEKSDEDKSKIKKVDKEEDEA